ncbi:hypothetical protein EC988_002129 [Linderina pennispora]|nr:hypothetical protein EC988_002129 [Linderina pennispora]
MCSTDGPEWPLHFLAPLFPPTPSPLVIVLFTLGLAINTGFMIGSGYALDIAGPGGVLVAYGLSILAMYYVITSLAEIVCHARPGEVLFTFGPGFIKNRSVGFALRWNYFLSWVTAATYHFIAVGTTAGFWFTQSSHASSIFGLCALLASFVAIIFSLRIYHCAELTVSALTIAAFVVCIVMGVSIVRGSIGNDKEYGTANMDDTPGGAFNNGILGIMSACVVSSFPVQGTEVAAVMISGTRNPVKNIRRISLIVLLGLLVLFIASTFVASLIVPYNDTRMLDRSDENMAYSPLTVMFSESGVMSAAHAINTVVLIEGLFNACTCLFIASRLLFTFSCHSFAPRWLLRLQYRGGPVLCILATMAMVLLIWCVCLIRRSSSLIVLSGVSAYTGFISWGAIAVIHITSRMRLQDCRQPPRKLAYKSIVFPLGPIYCLAFISVASVCQLYMSVYDGFDTRGFLSTCLGYFIFASLCIGAHLFYSTRRSDQAPITM